MDARLIVMLLIIVAVLGYYNCWFAQYGFSNSACPLTPTGNGSSGGQGGQGTGCPPLDDKMRASYNIVVTNTANACTDYHGTWKETDTEVSCKDPTIDINCTTIAVANAAEVCHTLSGVFHCQNNYVGCYCPGSGTVPYGAPTACGKVIDWGSGNTLWTAACQGPCPTGKNCLESGSGCICKFTPAL